jgi:hypothetical protein
MPRAVGLHGQRADHVVGLDALDHQDRPAHVAHHLVDRLDLLAQVFRHRGARGLVLGVHIVAEGLALGVEHAGDVGGREVGAQAAQHVDHAVHRAGRVAVRAAQVGQRVEGAIQVAGTVDEQQGILHRSEWVSKARRKVRHYRRIGMRKRICWPELLYGVGAHAFHREALPFVTMD